MDKINGTHVNAKDPLTKREAAPDPQLELFKRYSAASDGFQADHVINAAANMLINAMRQTYGNRGDAERQFNELFGKSKELMLGHYDSVTGRRKSIFPHTQVISPQHFVDKDK